MIKFICQAEPASMQVGPQSMSEFDMEEVQIRPVENGKTMDKVKLQRISKYEQHPLENNRRPNLKGFQKLIDGKYRVWINNPDGTIKHLGDMPEPPAAPGLWNTGHLSMSKREDITVKRSIAVYLLRLWGIKNSMFEGAKFDEPSPEDAVLLEVLAPYALGEIGAMGDIWEKYVKPVLPLTPYYTTGSSESKRNRAKRRYDSLSVVLLSALDPNAPNHDVCAPVRTDILATIPTWSQGSIEACSIVLPDKPNFIKESTPVKFGELFDLCKAIVGTNPLMRTSVKGGGRKAIISRAPDETEEDFTQRLKLARVEKKRNTLTPLEEARIEVQRLQLEKESALGALGQSVTLLYTHLPSNKRRAIVEQVVQHPVNEASVNMEQFTNALVTVFDSATQARNPQYPFLPKPEIRMEGGLEYVLF